MTENNCESLPFDSYPHGGLKPLGRVSTGNCRHGYGLKFMQITGQTQCAYCGLDLVTTYEAWLTMALDHVVPSDICKRWNLPEAWREDYSNRVLSCTACNTFDNRYQPKNFACPTTLEEFYELRNKIFMERRKVILEKHAQERAFFEQKLWTR